MRITPPSARAAAVGTNGGFEEVGKFLDGVAGKAKLVIEGGLAVGEELAKSGDGMEARQPEEVAGRPGGADAGEDAFQVGDADWAVANPGGQVVVFDEFRDGVLAEFDATRSQRGIQSQERIMREPMPVSVWSMASSSEPRVDSLRRVRSTSRDRRLVGSI